MISDFDRDGWIGASDTHIVMGPWATKGFRDWWQIKLGKKKSAGSNRYAKAGQIYEHAILEFMGINFMDRQIKVEELKLRVNLDGEDDALIHEVKTHRKPYAAPRAHWEQCQVEMLADRLSGGSKGCVIDAYRMTDEDYGRDMPLPINGSRLSHHPVAFNKMWLIGEYIPRLIVLRNCLIDGKEPIPHDALSPLARGEAMKYAERI